MKVEYPIKNCKREAKVNFTCWCHPADNGENFVYFKKKLFPPVKGGEMRVCRYHSLTLRNDIKKIRDKTARKERVESQGDDDGLSVFTRRYTLGCS